MVQTVTIDLPPFRPNDPRNLIQPWPRCAKCGGGPLAVTYRRAGFHFGITASDLVLEHPLYLDEHLVRTCERCGYWWREALALGS